MKTKQFCSWMAVGALVLAAASCQENESFDLQTEVDMTDVYGTGSKIVTLTLNPETSVGTRAGETETNYHISDGKKVNKLYFEVYTVSNDKDDTTFVPMESIDATSYPVTIKLAVEPETSYKIALWAQKNSETSTYTSPFTVIPNPLSVYVDYSGAKNNDEFRDAFCATQEFSGSATDVSVIMHRPFAQLNVGTTGADYNNYMNGNIFPHQTIQYSKMVVTGVYNFINIVDDQIKRVTKSSSVSDTDPAYEDYTDNSSTPEDKATFEIATIPALYYYTQNNQNTSEITFNTSFNNEEFLKVKLNADNSSLTSSSNGKRVANDDDNDGLLDYLTEYPTIRVNEDKTISYLTETFRYLSMAYVLVPSDAETDHSSWYGDNTTSNPYDEYHSSTLTSVEVFFGANEDENHKYFTVSNVPVHRNWRTNLLGGLWAPEEDDDPNDPDDPSSVFSNVKIAIQFCPIYFGEYNGTYNPSEDEGYTGINAGYFPTGDEDIHDNYGEHKKSTTSE